jgi:hypothetical protein
MGRVVYSLTINNKKLLKTGGIIGRLIHACVCWSRAILRMPFQQVDYLIGFIRIFPVDHK